MQLIWAPHFWRTISASILAHNFGAACGAAFFWRTVSASISAHNFGAKFGAQIRRQFWRAISAPFSAHNFGALLDQFIDISGFQS